MPFSHFALRNTFSAGEHACGPSVTRLLVHAVLRSLRPLDRACDISDPAGLDTFPFPGYYLSPPRSLIDQQNVQRNFRRCFYQWFVPNATSNRCLSSERPRASSRLSARSCKLTQSSSTINRLASKGELMAITRGKLSTMKEDQLQKEVLIPLLASMGFNDVRLHQGSTELGKDIVMWKSGDLSERVNYAVVAKAKKITGKATGKSSAAEVFFQIEQAFGNPWLDSTTTEQRRVDRCFVICSKQITNEAITAIKGVLENRNLDKVTRFINGDELWHLIQQNLPEKAVFENLKAIQNVLDGVSTHY